MLKALRSAEAAGQLDESGISPTALEKTDADMDALLAVE
jgi:hypothetical protein